MAGELRAVDAAIKTAVDTIPPENRKLVVYHDAWVYFARRYDLTMVGTIQPADFSEPAMFPTSVTTGCPVSPALPSTRTPG